MNILYLCDEYPPGRHGGIGTAVQLLAREMKRQGHNVVVAGFCHWGYGGEDKFEDQGIKVFRFRRRLALSILEKQDRLTVRTLYRLFKVSGLFHWDIKTSLKKYVEFVEDLIKKHNIDLVEMPDYCEYMMYCKSYVSFSGFSKPLIVKMHGGMTYIARENKTDVPEYIWQMEHDLLQKADAVVSVSKYNARKTAEYLKYDREIKVLYNGINAHIEQVAKTEKVAGRVVYTGSLSVNKGVYQLMKAWNIVNERNPNASLELYGKGAVSKLTALLNPQAVGTVAFKGHVSRSELFGRLASAELAIFPSFAESFAMAPMEAMACGTAVVYTKCASGPELIDDGVDGVLVDPYNVDEIADKITALLPNTDLCNTFAERGKEKVENLFDIRIIAQHHCEYYETILRTINR